MDASRSYTVHADAVEVVTEVVGRENFYLERPGFLLGGLGPAAVWAGGEQLVVDLVATSLRRFEPSTHQARRLGAMSLAAWQSVEVVRRVADRLDQGAAGATEVGRARATVARTVDQVVDDAGRVVGPGGLTGDAGVARAVADLPLYVRQLPLDVVLEGLGRDALHDAGGSK